MVPNLDMDIKDFENDNSDLVRQGKKISFGIDSFEEFKIHQLTQKGSNEAEIKFLQEKLERRKKEENDRPPDPRTGKNLFVERTRPTPNGECWCLDLHFRFWRH